VLKQISLFLIVIVALIFVYSCSATEEEDYTYSIEEIWWSDSIDTNADGYFQFKRLNFNLQIVENVTRMIDARLYYRLQGASEYTFYAFSGEKQVVGAGSDNELNMVVGYPNDELPRGYYDFKLEVYELDNTRLETYIAAEDTSLMQHQAFEESTNDKNFSINVWWSDIMDRNQNDYWRFASLKIDVDVDADIQKTLDADIYYKLSSEADYQLYCSIPDFTIFGTDILDTVSCIVGSPSIELDYGAYDFRIELLESNRLVAILDEVVDELDDIQFEPEENDSYYYSIASVWWGIKDDQDGDGAARSRSLNIDVDVDKDELRSVFAKIFIRHPDSTDYEKYDSTSSYNIFGATSADFFSTDIGSTVTELDSADYDFLITIYENLPDTLQVVEAAISAASESKLEDEKFETIAQDTP